MKHELKLQSKYFEYIKEGTKRIELRLYDKKRKNICIGDTIIFYKEPELNDKINTKVIGLLRYNNFVDLFNDFDIDILADNSISKNELLNTLEEFYPKEKQNNYGVIGIRIELMNDIK